MLSDCRGLKLSTTSHEAAAAFDHAMDGYLRNRADLPARMEALLKADPDFGLAHTMRGYFIMAGFKAELLPAANAALAEARRCGGTDREQSHADALGYLIAGDPYRAARVWDAILRYHPLDMLAFRVAHFINFWSGRPEAMLASVLAVEPHWNEDTPGWGALLACRCFAMEECGHYLQAEHAGREAIRVDPSDVWAAHGVAHVLEMQGRRHEGMGWIAARENSWDGANNLKHHLWWHLAMYHLEMGDFPRVLELYDMRFRCLGSELTVAAPDLYIDVQNAASMLYRLSRHGVEPGRRWIELANHAEARIGDCQSAFTLPHWMMALAATGRETAAQRMLDGMAHFAEGSSPLARLVREIALPVTSAVRANIAGRHEEALNTLRPVVGEMYRMGGSHAQQDVLEQVFLDSAIKAQSGHDMRMMMQRVAALHPVAPSRRRGYAMVV